MSTVPRCLRAIPITEEEFDSIGPVTLNGEPARVKGSKLPYGLVVPDANPHVKVEYSWETILLVVSKGGKFKA